MREIIKAIMPNILLKYYRKLRVYFFGRFVFKEISYSQSGEDRALYRYFERQDNGFYVDVGAHHPFRFSNTCIFYARGWRGINIDAMPQSMALFRKYRKNDINLEVAIGNGGG